MQEEVESLIKEFSQYIKECIKKDTMDKNTDIAKMTEALAKLIIASVSAEETFVEHMNNVTKETGVSQLFV